MVIPYTNFEHFEINSFLSYAADSVNHNPNVDLWPFKPKSCHLYFVGYPKVIPYTEFEHFGIICFGVLAQTLVWKMTKCTYWPCDLDLWPLNPKTVPRLGYPKIIPYMKFELFGIVRFWLMLRTIRQTQKNRQTDGLENPTHADRHSRRG